MLDPLDFIYGGDDSQEAAGVVGSSSSSAWGVADDWSNLSSDAANVAAAGRAFSFSSSASDVMDEAARILEEQDRMTMEGEWSGGAVSEEEEEDGDNSGGTTSASASAHQQHHVRATNGNNDDDFVEDAVEIISSHLDYQEADGVQQLYDTAATATTASSSSSSPLPYDREDDEIALMVRCNQSPDQLLISQGRALPELTDDVKYAANFLLEDSDNDDDNNDEGPPSRLPLRPRATAFFEGAVSRIFDTHSIRVDGGGTTNTAGMMDVMDKEGIARWMTTCIYSPLLSPAASSSSSRSSRGGGLGSGGQPSVIGPHDPSVSALLSRYSHNHGSGRLTRMEFHALYLEVAWAGYVRDIIGTKAVVPMPSVEDGILIEGKKNTEKMVLSQASVSLVWRDLEAHGIFSPAEEERVRLLSEAEGALAEATAREADRRGSSSSSARNHMPLMDECELLDEYYEERLSQRTYSDENDADALGSEGAWDFLSSSGEGRRKRERGSHELVEMASDGKTPMRIRDGQFVFIDEESCIGCTQCAQIAPSAFKMLDDGRARAFNQRNTKDVEDAVMACPVNCMHFLSFDELEEMESSRDDGDGRADHRHFGGGRAHTPLHVSGMDSDANHKSSWYHYLKWKCHGSSSCPQRGCYDCPTYAPGENPHFKERHRKAELARARDFMESGEADKWRKVVEL